MATLSGPPEDDPLLYKLGSKLLDLLQFSLVLESLYSRPEWITSQQEHDHLAARYPLVIRTAA